MKKALSIMFAACICLSLVGCNSGGPKDKDDDRTVVSRIVVGEEGYNYLEVDGKPFPYYGVEARLDAIMNGEKRPVEDFEPYMKAAADLGANFIAVPIDWRDIEPVKDTYEFDVVRTILGYAKKYNIKVEFCWYSVNMCGDGGSYFFPDYIYADDVTYPKFGSNNKGNFFQYGNICYLQASEALMEREAKAIDALMDYVYNWDLNNGETHPLIGVQVHNEPDGFVRWRLAQAEVKIDDRRLTETEAWTTVYTLLDNAGKAFKASKYGIVTRVNLTVLTEVTQFAEKILALEGIDAVGNDPYVESTGALRNVIEDFRKYLEGNLNHIAENKGVYTNTPGLMLTAAKSCAGYIIYDLSTPQYFIGQTSDPAIDHGILDGNFQDKPHTEAVRRTYKALREAGEALLLCDRGNFRLFNLASSHPETSYEATMSTASAEVSFKTEDGSVGFAIEYKGEIYLFATGDATVTVKGETVALSGGRLVRVALGA